MKNFIKSIIFIVILCVLTPLSGAVYFYDFTAPIAGFPTSATYTQGGGLLPVTVRVYGLSSLQPLTTNSGIGLTGPPDGVLNPFFFELDLSNIWPLSPTSIQIEVAMKSILGLPNTIFVGASTTSGLFNSSANPAFQSISNPSNPTIFSLDLSQPYNANSFLDINSTNFNPNGSGIFLVNLTVTTAAAPEPATIALLGSMIGIAVMKIRKRAVK